MNLKYNIYPVIILHLFMGVLISAPCCAHAFNTEDSTGLAENDTTKTSRLNLHFQATYIYQYKPEFHANYSGPNSLKTAEDKENSITATLYLGSKLWKGAELYINPEVAGGAGLSGAYGLAASTNGETFRVGDPSPTLYLARCFIAQTFRLHGPDEFIPETANETGGNKPHNFIKLLLGKMSLGDLFDNNACANSPRTQFMNWCLMNNGAWDYAANLRGYTYTFVTVVQEGNMTYKVALATLPTVANGPDLNTDLGQEYSLNAEVDKTYLAGKKHRKGNIRLLGYYNNGDMGNYHEALQGYGPPPNVILTRKLGRSKTGFGLNADQQLSPVTTAFLRLGWNDGQNETWCFTEADQSLSGGISIDGKPWKRSNDVLAFAVDVNGLSQNHRDYLKAGGLGFQLGDGYLNYGHESLFETYYSYKPPASGIWLTLDYQFVLNPGYNKDRGPVNAISFRAHVDL